MAFLAALDPPVAHGDAADWKTLRNSADDYSARYPATMMVSVARGRGCTDGDCHPIEQMEIGLGDGQSMTWAIQRNINPQHLPIRQWYESLVHRALVPKMERLVMVGGRGAIHRGPTAPGITIETLDGKEVSRREGLLPNDVVFVPLNDNDILTILIKAKTPEGKATFDAVLETVRFSR